MDKHELFYRRRVLLTTVEEIMGLMMLYQFKNERIAESYRDEGFRVARRLSEVQDLIEEAGYE